MKPIKTLAAALTIACCASSASAAPLYVGSFNVFDGPVWTSNPTVMSAKEVAAMLFGGAANDYAISVSSSLDPNSITNTAWFDGYGDTTYLLTPGDDDFKQSSRGDNGYDAYPAFSAWVCDHAACQAYGYQQNGPDDLYNYTNYVWLLEGRDDPQAVPLPATILLFGLGLGLMGAVRRNRPRG